MLHRAAATGFEAAASDYEAARPGYPSDAIYWLVEQLRLGEQTTVLDLAAGTGKLTRLLSPLVGRTIAVEPVAAMRARLHEVLPHAEVLDGVAESIPLEDSSVDAVTAAQAFHWFDAARAAAEIARVLRPAGRLAIVWNRRHLDDPAQAGIERIVSRYREDTPSHRTSAWRSEVEGTGLLRLVASKEIPFTHELSREGLVARVVSISFIAALPADEKREAMKEARELALELDEPIALPHTTELYALAQPNH
ncbi:MAG: class I SAM-dependent methyltransferase [Thermoleophilaceae bacterium]